MPHRILPACSAALAAAVLLAACGDRGDPRAQQVAQVRSSQAQAPDAAALVVGPDTRVMGGSAFGASCGVRALEQDMLERINEARAAGRTCGSRAMPPALPLSWDPQLQTAATVHSQDMARGDFLSHRSRDGSGPRQRVLASRYPARALAENIAVGDATVAAVVRTWLESQDHCANIMDPAYEDVAVACVQQPGSQAGNYWTMVLARKG